MSVWGVLSGDYNSSTTDPEWTIVDGGGFPAGPHYSYVSPLIGTDGKALRADYNFAGAANQIQAPRGVTTFPSTMTKWYGSVYLRRNRGAGVLPPAAYNFLTWGDVFVPWNTSGNLDFKYNGVVQGTLTIADDTVYRLSWYVDISASPVIYKVWQNGVLQVNTTPTRNLTTWAGANITIHDNIGRLTAAENWSVDTDHWIWMSELNGAPVASASIDQDYRIKWVNGPTGDGNYLQWTPSSGVTHYSLVNELPPDDATSYVGVTGNGTRTDSYTFPHSGLNSYDNLVCVGALLRGQNNDAGTQFNFMARYSGTDEFGTGAFGWSNTNTWQWGGGGQSWTHPFLPTAPGSVAWSPAVFDATEFGLQVQTIGGAGDIVHLTALYVAFVWYQGFPVPDDLTSRPQPVFEKTDVVAY